MIRTDRSFRNRLLLGASLGSLVLAGTSLAQNFGGRGTTANPATAAAQVAQNAASRDAAARAAAQRTRATLENATRVRAQMDAAQAAARAAALAAQSAVPNGLGDGGLKVANGIALDPKLWVGAEGPVQSQGSNGRTAVSVNQTQDKAILNWDSFNVGRETDLTFNHHGNSNWVTLNRVVGNSADPSQILGTIKADGSVYVLNQNGVIFGGASQVNARNIVAAAATMTDQHFRDYGIYARITQNSPSAPPSAVVESFTAAKGEVKVEAGARIVTTAPKSVVEGGGFVMLLGSKVENAGSIRTDRGQTLLAAGDSFLIRPGYGTDANQRSTTRGNEVQVTVGADSTAGRAINSGVIEARQGDITIAGEHVVQGGVAVATTNVHARGTVHLLTNVASNKSDTSVTLTGNSLTLILPELDSKDTATNAQRDALANPPQTTLSWNLNNQGDGNLGLTMADRLDRSRVEIMTGGTASFEAGSQTIAQGGQIAVMARTKAFVGEGAVLDVSGVRGVAMDMESNTLKVNVQPYEMRDSAVNREVEGLKHNDVWIDIRDLILLPSGTGGHNGDRYYTPGGLLEVGGHLSNVAHSIGEWASVGGSIAFQSGVGATNVRPPDSGQLVIQKGAILDISGGSLDYAAGTVRSTLFMGSDGKLYASGQAPAGVKMMSIGAAFMRRHERWGEGYTELFTTPFSRTQTARWEDGYTVGRDAGTISLSMPTVLMEGTIRADVVVGDRQTQIRPDLPIAVDPQGTLNGTNANRIDGYKLPQNVTPLAGGLYVGNRLEAHVPNSGFQPFSSNVTISNGTDVTSGMNAGTALTPDLVNNVQLSAESINQAGLGALRVSGKSLLVDADLAVAHGGSIALRAENTKIAGDLTARSGTISIEGVIANCSTVCDIIPTPIDVAQGVKIDATGLWVNLKAGGDRRDLAFIKGGDVFISSSQGSARLGKNSLIDVSAGGAILEQGETLGARGGDVVISASNTPRPITNELVLDGEIRSYGSGDFAGGTLIINNGGRPVTIGAQVFAGGNLLVAGQPLPMDMQLSEDLLLKAGMSLPFEYSYQVTKLLTGDIADDSLFLDFTDRTLLADWVVPDTGEAYDADFNWYGPGQTLPAGTYLALAYMSVAKGQAIPDLSAIYGGNEVPLPTPITRFIPAGTPLANDLTLAAGTTLKRGWTFEADLKVATPLHLEADFFQKGFTNYTVRAGGDLWVGDNTKLDVMAPVRRITGDSHKVASGAALDDAMELWTAPMMREDAANGRFIQRQGASLTLAASGLSDGDGRDGYGNRLTDRQLFGQLRVGKGAVLRVDDGQSIKLTAAESILFQGKAEARGGSVELTSTLFENMSRDVPSNTPIRYDPTRALWIDSGAMIDVSGRAFTAVDARGLRYASVSAGGSIHIGGELQQPFGSTLTAPRPMTAAYIVVREGAVLDASGASAEIDYLSSGLPAQRNGLLLATDGGRLAFDSQFGIFLDGDLRARAGGAGALGGELSIRLTTPLVSDRGIGTGREVPDFMRQLRKVIVDTSYSPVLSDAIEFGGCVTGCWTPGQTVAQANAANEGVADLVGQARIGADRVKAGGFDSLSLASDDVVLFNGDVSLNLGRNLTLFGSIANLDPDGHIKLSAAYVNFAGGGTMWGNTLVAQNQGQLALQTRPVAGNGSVTITGGLIDMAGIRFGVNGSIGLIGGGQRDYDYAASKDISIVSRSDIRLTGGEVRSMSNISLTAAQIYPTTGAVAAIYAGVYSYRLPGNTAIYNTMMQGGTVSFHTLAGSKPAAPLSVYGQLTVGADIINQGGVLVAPLGSITLGVGGDDYVPGPEMAMPGQIGWSGQYVTTSEVNLLPGSLTSVSGAGLAIPYGGTTDGLSWMLNGVKLGDTTARQGVTVVGSLRADAGAVLDLSGGGMPTGAGFTPGRGGSVDILKTALANVNPAYAGFSQADNKVYAIVPDYQGSAAPRAIDGHAQPEFGQQIIVPEGVPGLKAGTYMLLPAEFALMKGAYRVEMGRATAPGAGQLSKLPDGSLALGVHTGVANLATRSAQAVDIILTPADVVRTHSQYVETSFEKFLTDLPDRALFNRPPPVLPRDGKQFTLALPAVADIGDRPLFSFKGTGKFAAAEGGIGGSLSVTPGNYRSAGVMPLEILADGMTASKGAAGLYASDLNAVGATLMIIGGEVQRQVYGNSTITAQLRIRAGSDLYAHTGFNGITVREGATLSGAQIMLVSDGRSDITVEAGATLSTIGKGKPAFDMASGYQIVSNQVAMLAVSNGLLELQAPSGAGTTGVITVEDGAALYSEGTLAFASIGQVSLGEQVRYGARYLSLSTGSVNIGTSQSLAAAGEAGILPSGILLNQSVLERLMRGDGSTGAPALERLILTANDSVNFYGTVNLDTRGSTGASALQLVLNTPALYGHGSANDTATVSAATLVWNGIYGTSGPSWSPVVVEANPGAPIAGGPGTGHGTLNLVADRIVLGYQDKLSGISSLNMNRLALGFSTVNLTASQRIESNDRGTISVYESQAVSGKPGIGGALNITTPLLTGKGGSNVGFVAGGAIKLAAPQGWTAPAKRPEVPMGGEIGFTGSTVAVDTLVALPSGRLKLTARDGDVTLGDRARIDMAGMASKFFDETRYSWGGDVELESTTGDVLVAKGAVIDLSADYNHAGLLKVTALNGTAALDGTIQGEARNGGQGPNPELRAGGVDIRAGQVAGFAALNARLNEGGVTHSRSFLTRTGDLVIGDEVKARNVSITADGGSLTVTGRIDASGAKPGSIRLSAKNDLTLTGSAVLDARGTVLQVDAYGAPVEASNRATVELTSAGGTLALQQGATIDLASPDGVRRGRIELNARRIGGDDVAIAAAGALNIRGAASLSVNAFRSYQPAGGIIDQALLDGIHQDSDAFINAAIGNGALLGRIAGLRALGDVFHLRPGVELVSAPGGDLRVSGDLNLAGHRYASLNAKTQRAANYTDPFGDGYGSGEAGALLIRAAGDLDINGSITDGFGMPARTPDDNGWVLYPGSQGATEAWVQDYRLPAVATLGNGTRFPGAVALGYDLPVNGFTAESNMLLGAETRLASAFTFGREWVARADIRLPDGSVIARGAIIAADTQLPAGTVLGEGSVMPGAVSLRAMTWPKGVKLPASVTLSSMITLAAGDVIPRDVTLLSSAVTGLLAAPVTLPSAMELLGSATGTATIFPGGPNSSFVLGFGIVVRHGTQIRRGVAIPFGFETTTQVPQTGWTATAPIWASKAEFEAGAAPIIQTGAVVTARLPQGSWFGAGSTMPANYWVTTTKVPAGTPLNVFNVANVYLAQPLTLPAGTVLGAGVDVQIAGTPREQMRPVQADGTQGRIWATAPMLKQGSESWSMRFVAGADIGSADGRALRAATDLATSGQTGDLNLSDRHYLNPRLTTADGFTPDWLTRMRAVQAFSVVRTGTGSLDLLAGGSSRQYSLFGVYTAGTPSDMIGGTTPDGYNVYDQPRAILSGGQGLANPWIGAGFDGYADSIRDYRAWYPEHGGDLTLAVQGELIGYQTGRDFAYLRPGSGSIANWLWRQGSYGVAEGSGAQLGQDTPTAWWIHFGGYIPNNASSYNDSIISHNAPLLVGFTGIGTLGGGNLTVSAGGDAGTLTDFSTPLGDTASGGSLRARVASTGLDFAVAGTGRVTEVTRVAGFVTGGEVVQTGGGDMTIRIGGALNPMTPGQISDTDLGGTLTNLRGDIDVTARSIGWITLAPGDTKVTLATRGKLILSGVADPGSVVQMTEAGTSLGMIDAAGVWSRTDGLFARSSFTLWQDDTAIHLYSAGGTITPVTLATSNAARRDLRYWYPAILTATAPGGNIDWSGAFCGNDCNTGIPALVLSPSPKGQVEFLAGHTITGMAQFSQEGVGDYVTSMPVAMSGMSNSRDLLPNIFRPVWGGMAQRTPDAPVPTVTGNGSVGSAVAFQSETASGRLIEGRKKPALFYAVEGDVREFSFGMTNWSLLSPIYISSGSATIRAGRDIVNLGSPLALGCGISGPVDCRGVGQIYGGPFLTSGLVVHNDPRDITLISAGRDVVFANMTVAGPGNLIVEAGRHVYQGDNGRLSSMGPLFGLTPETRNGGAAITVLTGVGAGGPNYDAFAKLYLDPANRANAEYPLAHPENEGKVAKTYDAELRQWLKARFGYEAADAKGALDYFNSELTDVERGIFVRQVYYDELKAGGREYNDAEGPRFASYLRGRNAIAVLFPEKDATGKAISYAGDLTMFGGSGVRTLFGGNVELLVAGGQTLVGVGSIVPPSTAGVLSMGSGDIDIYSRRSVLLGQSRVFTTFGGDLLIWSAEGDINAGRGSKSTAVFQPPRRIYDRYGIVTLSPPTQNTGAGIATLAPIPEIPAGDVDLIAPVGVIDAGEAGIRVSGNVNLAALQVLNAANIKVEGEARGIPLPPVVNTSALTAASSASSAVVAEAVKAAERARPPARADLPVIVTVRLLGFGAEP
jgi:filamentous hemagglutinin family protein